MARKLRIAVSVFFALIAVAPCVFWVRNLWWRDAIWYWLLPMIFATFAAVPWLPWPRRFSLRTLLLATTFVAVVLGLVVWAGR